MANIKSVRRVIDESDGKRPNKDMVIFRVVASEVRSCSTAYSRDEFSLWTKYEVFRNENAWQRIDTVRGY